MRKKRKAKEGKEHETGEEATNDRGTTSSRFDVVFELQTLLGVLQGKNHFSQLLTNVDFSKKKHKKWNKEEWERFLWTDE